MTNTHKPALAKCAHCPFKLMVRQFLNEEEFKEIYNSSIQLTYKKGEHLLKQGSRFDHIVFLSNGCVKFNYENELGKNLILTIVDAPRLIGGVNMFNDATNMFSITAIEETEACLIDIAVLKNLALQNSDFALHLLGFVSAMFKDSILNFISLAHKHVNGRVADVLIYLSEKVYKKKEFTLTLSRKELAEFAGCSQENIIHTLSRFNKECIIKSDVKKIKIVDLKRLREISRLG